MNGIPLYSDINDLHRLTGSALRTENPLFHCFDMANANDLTVHHLPPHRTAFYTLALNSNTRGLYYTLNETEFCEPQYFLVCVAPGQVVKWVKNGDWFGYCTFFKNTFLNFPTAANFLQQYPFFNIHETNLLPVQPTQVESLALSFRQLIAEQQTASPFSQQIIQATLQSILWQVRRIYEESPRITTSQKAQALLTAQFQYVVNEHFLHMTTVQDYADYLNVTANHLSQVVREVTGQPAKRIITQRRLVEACYLLQYTSSDVAEIAFYLNFTESTHFVKFFKKETGSTPSAYRAGQHKQLPGN